MRTTAINILVLFITAIAPTQAAYAETLDCSLAGLWNLPFSEDARAIVVSGTTAYVAANGNWDGLAIYNIADPHNPIQLGSVETDYPYDVAVEGDYAYLADEEYGLRIINISDPANPVIEGTFDTDGYAQGVEIAGSYAYVADEGDGLKIINITTPSAPTLAGSYPTDEDMYNVVVRGNYAYVAEDSDGMLILDISTPTAPSFVGRCVTDDYVYDVKVDGDYAYLADEDGGLQIVDISTLSAPIIIGTYDTKDYATGVFVSGDLAYVAVDSSGLEIVDISVKTAPVQAGIVDTRGTAYNVFVSGGFAYVADSSSVAVIDVSTPAAPVLEAGYNPSARIEDVCAVGDLLYLACDKSGLQILDAGTPDTLVRLGGCLAGGTMERVFVQGSLACLAAGDDGMYIFDVSDSSNPIQIGHLDALYQVNDIYVRAPYVYVADKGLRVIDISDPASPQEVGFRVTSRPSGIWISDDIAYVADYNYGIRMINIQNPFNPTLISTYSTGQTSDNLYCRGDTLYISYYNTGLEVVDISDPSTPTRLGGYDTSGTAHDLYLSGGMAMIADYRDGLQVIDIQEPTTPVLAGSYNTEGFPHAITVANGYAYMAAPGYGGIQIMQVSSTNTAVVSCTRDRFALATTIGQSPAAVSFNAKNAGTGTLNYTVASDVPWISPVPTTGNSTGESDPITLNFSTAGLSAGYHTGTVSVSEAGALNSPFPIPVELWVEPLPLAISSPSLPTGMEMVPYAETLTATDGMPPYIWTQVSGWPGGLTNATAGTVSGTPVLAGTYTTLAEVTDARGKTAAQNITVQIQPNPNRPPIISSTVPSLGTFPMAEQTNQLFSVTAADPESVPLSYSWTLDGAPIGIDSSTYTFNTVWGDAGTYELEVRVVDDLWDTVIAAWTIEVTNDNDGDGIPNDFENAHPLLSAWNASDGTADPDGDHLDNYGEYLAETLLDNPDCDGDSLPDGWEVRYGYDPLDEPGGLTGILCTLEGAWTDGWIGTLTAQGNYLYTGTTEAYDNWGFRIFDISNPANPTIIGGYNIADRHSYREIVINGSYAYMAEESTGIHVFNISNPSAPSRVRVIAGEPYGLCIGNNHLYETGLFQELNSYSLGNPSAPSLLATLPDTRHAWDIASQGNYAYIARDRDGFQIIDVRDPSAPFIVASLPLSAWNGLSYAVDLQDDYAYIAAGAAGMQVVDISIPTNPVWVASCNTPGSAFDIHIDGNYAYIANYDQTPANDKMQVIDISDPTAPRLVGGYNAGREVYTIHGSGNLVYLGAGNGLHVVRCTSEDTDADGMLDAWEMTQWTNLVRTGTDDFDHDGISDLGEFRAGLDPRIDDEDEDGIIDGTEVLVHNSNPHSSDSDGDGISDPDELICGTAPSDPGDVLQFTETASDTASSVSIVWQSVPGHDYRVDYSTDLGSNVWNTAASSIGASSNTCSFTDPETADQPVRYYRVLALP